MNYFCTTACALFRGGKRVWQHAAISVVLPVKSPRMRTTLLVLCILLFACHPNPYKATNKAYTQQAKKLANQLKPLPPASPVNNGEYAVGTTNFGLRKPNFVILHHTAQNSCDETLKTFTLTRTQVSSHYVICRNGTIHQMLNDYLRAWHGGASKWGNSTDINSNSIGIEIDNNGSEPFSEAQVSSLLVLLDTLKKRHSIPNANFIGHGDIAPGRKVDPSVLFPWKQLSDKGFGIWWDDTTNLQVPPDFNSIQALRIVGYDVKDTSNAIAAFKRKFLQQDKSRTLTDADRKVLYSLMKKSM
jgi:N-acetylmuramoyl-L-alanine amidase